MNLFKWSEFMKKVILTFIFCGITILGLTGCGKISKDEMLENAETLKITELRSEMYENSSRAKSEYNNKVYKYIDYIYSIEDDYIYLGADNIKVYLSEEAINKLSTGQQISIVGKLTNLNLETQEETMGLGEFTRYDIYGIMKNAYLIDETFKIEGTISINNKNDWNCCLITSSGEKYYLEDNISEKNRNFDDKNNIILNGVEIFDGNTIAIEGQIINNRISGMTSETFSTNSKDTFTIKDIKSVELIDK